MATPYRNFSDRARFPIQSTVRDTVVVPFGFTVSSGGAITTANNANPPQVWAQAGANNQTYTLKCPVGNPAKIWAYITCEEDIVAAVTDYSTITSGTLTISLSAAPAGDTVIKGFLVYGRNFGEGKGSVLAAPSPVQEIAAIPRFPMRSILKQATLIPISWTVNGSNVVTETRGPLGAEVTPQGSGVYWITYDWLNLPNYPANWAEVVGASDGRNVSISHSSVSAAGRVTTIVTFEDGANMGNGETATLMMVGSPEGEYRANYGGASGGVHSDLATRDISNYGHFPMMGPMRNAVFIPIHAVIAASTAGPTEATSNLPPGVRIVRASSGVYTLYIGKYKSSDICCAFNLSNGAAIGPTAFGGDAGTITLTAPSGDPGACTLSGFVVVRSGQVEA